MNIFSLAAFKSIFDFRLNKTKQKTHFISFQLKPASVRKKLKEIERKREGARFKTEREQCDQMARLCVQFWPFKAM